MSQTKGLVARPDLLPNHRAVAVSANDEGRAPLERPSINERFSGLWIVDVDPTSLDAEHSHAVFALNDASRTVAPADFYAARLQRPNQRGFQRRLLQGKC